MKDKDSLPKRVRRYAQVSTAMVGVGAQMALRPIKNGEHDRKKRAEALRLALGGLKGPLMKIAQILSTIPDAVPEEYARELAQLQADAPPMGWPFVKRRMMAELGANWEKEFQSFSRVATAAASLGQVHRARTHEGHDVACKLQYPDMASAVEADMKQLGMFFKVFEFYDRAVSTKLVQQEIADRLREELDYVREAKSMRLYEHILKDVDVVHIPVPIERLSTTRLLTMSWLDGRRLVDVAVRSNQETRNRVAMNMFKAWYTPFYGYGIIHGDPHLGNYSVRDDLGINLLDFGCIRVFKPALVHGVITLYDALLHNNVDQAAEAYRAWGFTTLSKDLVDVLNIWARFIYAPLLDDKAQLIEETNTGVYGRETANKVHAELRKLGGVTVPREFVFMDRAAIGLGSVFLRLKADLNWYRMFHELIDGFDVNKLAKAQTTALRKVGLAER